MDLFIHAGVYERFYCDKAVLLHLIRVEIHLINYIVNNVFNDILVWFFF